MVTILIVGVYASVAGMLKIAYQDYKRKTLSYVK